MMNLSNKHGFELKLIPALLIKYNFFLFVIQSKKKACKILTIKCILKYFSSFLYYYIIIMIIMIIKQLKILLSY